jgi:hypothetical protein
LSNLLQSAYTNAAVPLAIKTDLDEIKSEVRSLKDMLRQLMRLNSKLIAQLKKQGGEQLDYSDITPDELMMQASKVFNVTSAYDPDDDLIDPNAMVKPVDFSGYA